MTTPRLLFYAMLWNELESKLKEVKNNLKKSCLHKFKVEGTILKIERCRKTFIIWMLFFPIVRFLWQCALLSIKSDKVKFSVGYLKEFFFKSLPRRIKGGRQDRAFLFCIVHVFPCFAEWRHLALKGKYRNIRFSRKVLTRFSIQKYA
jgi:hypothetical protein